MVLLFLGGVTSPVLTLAPAGRRVSGSTGS